SDTIAPIAYGFLLFGSLTYFVVKLGIKYTPLES
ncbi:MAG: hypothetical protein ACI82S_003384, partial [Patiriisocius sp.]